MANELKMANVHSIQTLHERGWSNRRIAKELGIHRDTVSRHLRLAPKGAASDELGGSKPAKAPPGSGVQPSGSRSECAAFCEIIEAKLDQGLTSKRIHQDLVAEHGFASKYHSVRRFVSALGRTTPLPMRRMECSPGEQVQVDLGTGAPIVGADGRRRRTHVFRIVLSYSRKGYSEAIFRQRTDSLLQCLENAFWYFGGVPKTVVIDNPKALVKHPDWYDPQLNPRLQSFAEHYGTVVMPTKPYTPRHKGKIERGIGYVKGNALKGHTFASLAQENQHLLDWETSVADTRIHGTTRKQVGKVFEEVERQALGPLPPGRFPLFQEAQRSVHRDGHVEVAKAYYSVPPEHVGHRLWVRWDGHLVRIFTQQMEQIAVHVQQEPGKFSTHNEHIHARKFSNVERGAEWLLYRTGLIGQQARRWGKAMLANRGVAGLRVLIGLHSLTRQYTRGEIDRACEVALSYGAYRLRPIRQLLKRGDSGARQGQLELLAEHEIIRDMESYGDVVRQAMQDPLNEKGQRQDDHRIPDDVAAKAAAERVGPNAGRASAGGGR